MAYQREHVCYFILTMMVALFAGLLLQVWGAEYSYQTIDVPFLGSKNTTVTGINANGLMVGSFNDAQNALWGFTLDPNQGGLYTRVYMASRFLSPQGVNIQGQLVGNTSFGCGRIDGFVYEFPAELGTIWHIGSSPITEPMDINDAGAIVGDYQLNGMFHGFYRTPSGGVATIDVPAARSTAINSLNNSDQMVGTYLDTNGFNHGFFLWNGAFSGIDYPGAPHTFLETLTESGLLVGTYLDPTSFIGIGFATTDGQNFDLIFVPGAQQTFVKGANALGMIVGVYLDASNVYHGFVATPSTAPMAAFTARSNSRAKR